MWGEAFERLAKSHEVVREESAWQNSDQLKSLAKEAQVLVVRNRTQVDRALLGDLPELKLVARAGVGLDNIDVAAADEHGIAVVAGLGANAVSVGELAIAMALSLLRNVVSGDAEVRSGGWVRKPGRELSGSTWGLVGCGATGLATARLLSGFQCRVMTADPALKADDQRLKENAVELVDLDFLLANSDVISLHAPLVDATRNLINQDTLRRMKRSSILINVARGELVNEDDLVSALTDGVISGAGLDVRVSEPPSLGRLEQLPNVVLAPHVAGITEQSQERIAEILVADIERALGGTSLQFAVGRVSSVN